MLRDILEEHFDEASFLAERWMALVDAQGRPPQHGDVVALRLQAHIEAILSGGALVSGLCEAKLGTSPTTGDIFVVATAARWAESTQKGELENALSVARHGAATIATKTIDWVATHASRAVSSE